ncbi:MAG: hypothetical protein HY275_01900 [Gemmatimonadetes bacterium]|nr:hypothetical protein [Gemmatimonadota bacterium]
MARRNGAASRAEIGSATTRGTAGEESTGMRGTPGMDGRPGVSGSPGMMKSYEMAPRWMCDSLPHGPSGKVSPLR